MKRLVVVMVACVAMCCVSGYALGAFNRVVNGGFETGDFTGWLVNGAVNNPGTFWTDVTTQDNNLFPNSGAYFAEFGNYPGPDTISQTFRTKVGQEYDFSFWLASEGYVNSDLTPNNMTVTWADGSPSGPPEGDPVVFNGSVTSTTWTEYSYRLTADSSLTTITFSAYDNPSFIGLDDVSVSCIPEPATIIIWSLLGGLGIALGVWRRKRAA